MASARDYDMINLLDDVDAAIRRYCVMPDEHSYAAVSCWVAYTHMSDLFDFAPRLLVRSPEKQSGKSRLLEVIGELVYHPSYWVKPTEATLFRKIDAGGCHPPTIIFDEVDAWLPESPDAVRGLINTGFRVGATVPRMGGSQFTDLQEFSVFAPIALAGIGSVSDTIEDRSVIIEMRRRKRHERVQKYRVRESRPALNKLRDELAACSRDDRVQELVAKALRDGIPIPDVGDRQEDAWEPLLITAAVMGGKSWVERALFACKHICDAYRAEAPASPLLSDIAGVFDRAGHPQFMSTEGGDGLRTHLTVDAECRESGWGDPGPGYLSAKKLGGHAAQVRNPLPQESGPDCARLLPVVVRGCSTDIYIPRRTRPTRPMCRSCTLTSQLTRNGPKMQPARTLRMRPLRPVGVRMTIFPVQMRRTLRMRPPTIVATGTRGHPTHSG